MGSAASKNGGEAGGGGGNGGGGGGSAGGGGHTVASKTGGRRGLMYGYGGRRVNKTELLSDYLNRTSDRVTAETEDTTTASTASGEIYTPPKISSLDITTKLQKNRDEHHTNEYDCQELIVRRGQPFCFDVKLERAYDKEKDEICLEFKTGKKPSFSKGTRVLLSVSDVLSEGKWGATIDNASEEHVLSLKVQSLSNCPVGRYHMSVIVKSKSAPKESKDQRSRLDCEKAIYIIFNPWCEKDAVYMANEDERNEYVIEDVGYLWYGSYKQIGKRPWNFGQFEDSAFDAALYLLQDQDYAVEDEERGNPVLVCRKMSAAINEQDDGGVLVGNWSGNYEDGSRPTSWNGSVAILEQYMKGKMPVKYGQCWVFSGVLTTILRSLGIPARSVTNYASAHDTDSSMTIDKHLDPWGEPIEWLDSDSVWNFHVWNDCWMTRPDLPSGYGGWQAIDATPQETSEGIFQAGPASLNAIRQGHVYLPYDTKFLFAEINGDIVYWDASDGAYEMEKIRYESSAIGRGLYTKAIGELKGMDASKDYKHPEGSNEERLAVECAVQHGSKPDTYCPGDAGDDDVSFAIDTVDRIYVGSDFDVTIQMTNKCDEERNISLSLIVQVCYYTGVLSERVKTERKQVTVKGNSDAETIVHVTVEEYIDKLVDQSAMKIFLMGRVKETKQVYAAQDDFRLRTPDVDVSVSETHLKVGQEFKATMVLKNPLPRTLTNCCFNLEGAGVQRSMTVWLEDIPPNEEAKKEVTLTAKKPGKKKLVVDFDSDQLSQVHADVDLQATTD